jgi:large subunit ribosomal protein L22
MAIDPDLYGASHRFARISAQKARLVMDLIRGVPVEKALTTLRFSERRASPMIRKVLRSALANATQKAGLAGEDLVVYRAFVDGGPIGKRWKTRSMGRAYPRLRRTCHLSIVLKKAERKETPRKARRDKASKAAPNAAAAPDAAGQGSTE